MGTSARLASRGKDAPFESGFAGTGEPLRIECAMQWARPKSLSGLMLLGLALIAVPLLVAVLTAALQIRQLADTGQKIVVEGVTAARASQSLFSQISSLERTARLYDILNDANLLELYRHQDAGLTATRIQLERRDQSPTSRKTLGELGELQRNIGQSVLSMQAGKATSNATGMSRRFTELGALATRWLRKAMRRSTPR